MQTRIFFYVTNDSTQSCHFGEKQSLLAFDKIVAIKGVNQGFSVIIWNIHHYIPDGSYFYITIICQDLKIN